MKCDGCGKRLPREWYVCADCDGYFCGPCRDKHEEE